MTPQDDGYRLRPAGGPIVRTDIVDVHIICRDAQGGVSFLQLERGSDPYLGTWHPVMGHVEAGESSLEAAARELNEETGLTPDDDAFLGMWQLEQVHPFFIAALDQIVMSPRFVVEVADGWMPALTDENTAARWVGSDRIEAVCVWPGQVLVCREILEWIVPGGPTAALLRVHP